MKKLLAIVLSLMLLTASAALAENASTLVFSDPVMSVSTNGEVQQISLAGVTLTLSAGMSGDVPAAQFDITGSEGELLSGEMQLSGDKLLIALDGMSRPLAVDVSAAGDQGIDGIKTIFEGMAETGTMKLPAFTGVTIPKLDLMSYAGFLPFIGVQTQDIQNGVSLEMPFDTVMMLLSYVQEYKDAIPETAMAYLGGLFDSIDQMNKTGDGFALKGTLTDDGTTTRLAVELLPVANKQTSGSAIGALDALFAENQVNIAVDTYTDAGSEKLFDLALTSKPLDAELSFALNIAGAVDVTGSLYSDGDLQVVALEAGSEGDKIGMSFVYGEQDGADYAQLDLAIPNQAALSLSTQTVGYADGGTIGTLSFVAETYEATTTTVTLDADIACAPSDVAFRGVDTSAGVYDVANLTEAETAQMSEELNNVLAGLMNAVVTYGVAA